MKRPLLSIVVPTKNRYKYLKSLIELFKKLSLEGVELIIQDNSDDNTSFKDYIATQISDSIHYYHESKHLSVCGNSDLAILHANGEYITFIGDDDGFTREILPCVKYMKQNNIDSLLCNKIGYTWPDVHGVLFDFAGTFFLKEYTKKYTQIDLNRELLNVLKKGATTLGKLPCVYHGIVRRSTLEKIYDKTGTFFPGPSPDMANAIALSLVSSKHVYYDYPITIAGHGAKSAGGLGAKHQHVGDISKMSFLPEGTAERWEALVPKYWTGETIYAETAIKSLRNMNRVDLVSKFNYEAHYGRFLAFHFGLRSFVKPFLRNSNRITILKYILLAYCKRTNFLLRNFFGSKNLLPRYYLQKNVNDIIASEESIAGKTIE